MDLDHRESIHHYPTAIFCIIATEFCERFSFCGLRTILSIYLRNELSFSENAATIIYHVFIMSCYIVPIAGAFCADSIFGRYRTIQYFSMVYLAGNMLMCISAIPIMNLPPLSTSLIGLLLISVGTGGIKPCVAAFGGDQFHLPDQKELLQHFFSVFYFTINLGGFVGMIVTPILRKWITCFGEDTCYALGFGFPAALMFMSLFLFIMGRPLYRMKTPKENIILQFAQCTTYALLNRSSNNRHWLDASNEKFDKKLIHDMKTVYSVLFLFVPLPIFWSLFDQQGSRWTFQASHMNGDIFGMQIVPDQVQVVNPAMVLIMIPIFDRIIPIFERAQIMKNTLHRMAIGGMFAAMAFLAAGILELVLEQTYPKMPPNHHASIYLINTLPCAIKIHSTIAENTYVHAGGLQRFIDLPCENETLYEIEIMAAGECEFFKQKKYIYQAILYELQIDTVVVGVNPNNEVDIYITPPIDFEKSLSGKPRLRVAFLKSTTVLSNITVSFKSHHGFEDVYFLGNSPLTLTASAYLDMPPGLYDCTIAAAENPRLYHDTFDLALGGVYSLILRERNATIEFFKLFVMSSPNTVNMLWLLPQYFLISIAEILFGISGLEFSFTQAPKSMKTITIAGWYLSVAFGNFLVIAVTQANLFRSQALQFFLFATVMVADMMLFIEMASDYQFVPLEGDSSVDFEMELLLSDADTATSTEEYVDMRKRLIKEPEVNDKSETTD